MAWLGGRWRSTDERHEGAASPHAPAPGAVPEHAPPLGRGLAAQVLLGLLDEQRDAVQAASRRRCQRIERVAAGHVGDVARAHAARGRQRGRAGRRQDLALRGAVSGLS